RKEMFQVSTLEDGVRIKGVYGPAHSGYSKAADALDMAEWALKNYGITRANLTLLVRQGSEYVPTTLKEVEGRKVLSDTIQKLKKAKGPKATKNLESAAKAGLLKKRQPD